MEQKSLDCPVTHENAKVIGLSKVSGNKLHERLKGMHLAFSSLAMHRIGLKEAASLKLRESMLLGFPAVLGYRDTDLELNKELSHFTFTVNANESPVDFERVIEFYKNVSKTENHHLRINALAKKQFSFEAKADQYLSFFRELVA